MIERLHRVLNGEAWEELKLQFHPVTEEVIYHPASFEFKSSEPLVEEPEPKKATPVLDMLTANPTVQKAIARSKPEAIEARHQTAIREIERLVGTSLNRYEVQIYREAYRELVDGEFHRRCSQLIGEYHAGDCKLRQLLLRGALRASFSSKSALLHFAMTGATGSGKNDLIENVAKILPIKNIVMYSSITPQVLYYEMRVPVPGVKNGWTMNPDHFKNCIICVTEIADSKAFTAMKAYAELNEFSSYTHKATSGQRSLDLTVRGPRSMWVSSVMGMKDDQANRRFIHSQIDEENPERREARVNIISDSLTSQRSLADDPRMRICRAGFDLLFASKPRIEPPNEDVAAVISDLNGLLDKTDHSPSQFKQLYALMECGAVLRQFERGYVRIEMQDVLEGWFLSGFENHKEMLLGGKWCKPIDPMDGC